MKYPDLKQEKKLWKGDYKFIVGLDEAGRGPLAGPVVAGAVVITNPEFNIKDFKGLKDSKKLSAKQRERFYKMIIDSPNIQWGRGRVSEKIIDRINILQATKLAMKKAVKILEKKLKTKNLFLILDGNMLLNLPLPQKSVIRGDEKVFSCASASILAKVTRDRIMARYHKKHPQYRFDLHKGYGTKLHLRMLRKYGPSSIHRKTFKPVLSIAKR